LANIAFEVHQPHVTGTADSGTTEFSNYFVSGHLSLIHVRLS
jgi:hypothetical protein